ncbi:hypothetical protein ACI3PL_20545, partial [Lacticaseibacillus paracasei]
QCVYIAIYNSRVSTGSALSWNLWLDSTSTYSLITPQRWHGFAPISRMNSTLSVVKASTSHNLP